LKLAAALAGHGHGVPSQVQWVAEPNLKADGVGTEVQDSHCASDRRAGSGSLAGSQLEVSDLETVTVGSRLFKLLIKLRF
jgi:hypothetical protein